VSIQYGESSADDVIVSLPRGRRPHLYSAHSGTSGVAEPASSRQRAQAPAGQRPPHPADLAQSRLFEALLLDDIDELEDRAATVERRWLRRRDRKTDDAETLPHDLKQLRHRITEARRLLDALHARFPPE
jgi:hypothetical protein